MISHSCVDSIDKLANGLYLLSLSDARIIRVFICECYSFGVAEYMETAEKLGDLDAVVISSNWCGYTYEAKKHCRDSKVGLYDIAGFMAALNRPDLWAYLTDGEKEIFKERGWL
ncbi:hypothetical protein [Hyphobacterium sp.]|uniref:hypothetical protein n=1 Tax=Hyphobacterium sp. TaxID=2004662 RepID=UPI003BA8B4A4